MNAIAEVQYANSYRFGQLDTRFDVDTGVYWGFMDPQPSPVFSSQLLNDLRDWVNGITQSNGVCTSDLGPRPIAYTVIASKVPGVFSLGGDLSLFRDAIVAKDRVRLAEYAEQCVDNLYPWYTGFNLPITTISLVQGEALGGGFECALASTVLIAEESARMGFPEVLFNLFPGMGAYSFLLRKVGRRSAEELITSGAVYTARQLYDMGVVDVITPDGSGEAAVASFVKKHAKTANGRRAIERVRNEIHPLTRDELSRVVGIWIDAAMRLEDRDLRLMERLVRAQKRTATQVDVGSPNVLQFDAARTYAAD